MMLIATSLADPASTNIRERLLEAEGWEEIGTFDDQPAYQRGDRVLVTIKEMHLHRDHLDRQVSEDLGIRVEVVAYASRHRSESGMRSFTVHPLGNFREAEFGGLPRRLVTTAPHWMTQALRLLARRVARLDYTVSFEATHHGPYLEAPTFYIEVGSDERAWLNLEAARAIADVLLELQPERGLVALGIGGGHYVPRITDVALRRRVSFGHLIPSYVAGSLDDDMLYQAMEKSPEVEVAYVHRKAFRAAERRRLEEMLRDHGLRVVRQADIDPVEGTR